MAYPSHVAARDAAARSGGISRTVLAGCALAAMTAGLGYGLSHYVDFGGALGPSPAAPAQSAAATPATDERLSLFEPRLSLGVGGGFVPAPRRQAAATSAAEPMRVARAAPAEESAPAPLLKPAPAAKPAPLPDDAAAEADIPLPPARPAAPEVAAAAPDVVAPELLPEPPRRPVDLAPAAPALRPPALAARPERLPPPGPSFRMTAPTAPQVARSAPAPRYERTDNFERLIPGDGPAPGRIAAAQPAPPRARGLSRRGRSVVARTGGQEPSFFEKLFGGAAQPAGALAYAPTGRLDDAMRPAMTASIAASSRRQFASLGPDAGARSAPSAVAPRFGGGRAIYDISAQVVVMPDGTRLEAHSGLGQHRDDPRSQRLRMRGVTPPGVYDLREREALFHGVRAIRMTPQGGAGAIHGRNGILAHTYMLGPNGDSNGCVSFRNYNAFLNAFLDGKVSQLVVVESMSGLNRFALR